MVDISRLNEKSVVRVEEADKFWLVKNFQVELVEHATIVADWYLYKDDELVSVFKQHRCDAFHFKKPNYRLLINLKEKSLKDYL